MIKLTKLFKRRKHGVGAMEVAISAGLMIVVCAIALDVTLINYAFVLNDQACRDACRAAAQCPYAIAADGTPDAQDAAKAALAMHATSGPFLSQPQLVSSTPSTSASAPFVYVGTDDAPSLDRCYVTVTTYMDVGLPVPLLFMGNNFAGALTSNGGKLRFTRKYTFPIVHIK